MRGENLKKFWAPWALIAGPTEKWERNSRGRSLALQFSRSSNIEQCSQNKNCGLYAPLFTFLLSNNDFSKSKHTHICWIKYFYLLYFFFFCNFDESLKWLRLQDWNDLNQIYQLFCFNVFWYWCKSKFHRCGLFPLYNFFIFIKVHSTLHIMGRFYLQLYSF